VKKKFPMLLMKVLWLVMLQKEFYFSKVGGKEEQVLLLS
jgi:hypothetical protein